MMKSVTVPKKMPMSRHDVLIRVNVQTSEVTLFLSQCLTEILRSPGNRILVRAMGSNLCQTVCDFLWRVEVWESL